MKNKSHSNRFFTTLALAFLLLSPAIGESVICLEASGDIVIEAKCKSISDPFDNTGSDFQKKDYHQEECYDCTDVALENGTPYLKNVKSAITQLNQLVDNFLFTNVIQKNQNGSFSDLPKSLNIKKENTILLFLSSTVLLV